MKSRKDRISGAITRVDLPRIRRLVAQKFPVEQTIYRKWAQVNEDMGTVPVPQTIRSLKIVLFLCGKVESILVDDVAYRSQEGTLRALDRVDEIKTQAAELLASLEV